MTIDRKTAPQVQDAISFQYNLPPINSFKLDNGIPLYWVNAGVQEVVEIDWVFPAGLWYESGNGVARAVATLLNNGTSKRSARDINEALEFYGASLRVRPGNDNATVSLFCLTKHLAALLPIVYEIITDSVFPQDELDIYRQNEVQKLMVNLRKCDFVANQKIDAYLFGEDHPYGRYSKKTAIEGLNREQLQGFYKERYNLAACKVFMAGNISEREKNIVNDVFGKIVLTSAAAPRPEHEVKATVEKKHNIINDEKGVQGAIRIGSMGPNRLHPDFAPLVIANTVLGGYFGSRLMSNIREEKGYTYGIYSSMTPMQHGGTFIIQTEVGRDVVEPAVKEIYHELDVLCNERVSEEELLLVKNYLLGSLLGDLDGPFHIIQRWRTLILNGQGKDDFDKNVELYKSITATQVQDIAQQYFAKDNFHELVVV